MPDPNWKGVAWCYALLVLVITGDRRELRILQGVVVGKSAREVALPSGWIIEATVENIMRWSRIWLVPITTGTYAVG